MLTLDVTFDGVFTLVTLKDDDPYAVFITAQPDTPNQECSFDTASAGDFDDAGVQIDVSCVTQQYNIIANVTGLVSDNTLNVMNGSDTFEVTEDGSYIVSSSDDGSSYDLNLGD